MLLNLVTKRMIVPTYVAALMVTLIVAAILWWYAKTVDILFEYPFTNRKANAQQGGILDIMTG